MYIYIIVFRCIKSPRYTSFTGMICFSNYKHLAYQLQKNSAIKQKSNLIISSCFLKSMTVKISRYEYQYHNLKNLKKIYLLSVRWRYQSPKYLALSTFKCVTMRNVKNCLFYGNLCHQAMFERSRENHLKSLESQNHEVVPFKQRIRYFMQKKMQDLSIQRTGYTL